MGRQRLDENIFKHEAILFYKLTKEELSEEKFNKILDEKKKETFIKLKGFSKLDTIEKASNLSVYRVYIQTKKYTDDYVSISEKTGQLTYNKLVELHERRAWEIQQLNYKDDISVIKSLQDEGYGNDVYTEEVANLINEFLKEFNLNKNFERCMRLYCTFLDQFPQLFIVLKKISDIPTTFHMYYELLGHDGIKSYAYKEYALRNEVEIKLQNPEIRTAILFNFQPGNKYTKKYIKEKLQEIYNQFDFKKIAKASDLEEYFILNRVKISNKETGKRDEGFEIINIK